MSTVRSSAVRRCLDWIMDVSTKLPKDTLAAKLRRMKAVLIFYDTETTGLKDWVDVIHEAAIIAVTPKNMVEIGKLHMKLMLEKRRPEKMIEQGTDKLYKVLHLATTAKMNKIVKSIEERCTRMRDDKNSNEKSYCAILYNTMQSLIVEYKIDASNEWDIRSLYWGLWFIIEGLKTKWVLAMTEYSDKDGDHLRLDEERHIASKFNGFLAKVERSTKLKPIMVAQNWAFDQQMTYASARRTKQKFKFHRFIDTVLISRKYISRHMLVTFIYLYSRWLKTRKKVYADMLLKLKPLTRNKLGVVTNFFGISNPNWHTAINDVRVLVELLKVQLAVDLRYRLACRRIPELLKIEKRIMADGHTTKKGEPRDFLHGPNDPYRKQHTELYKEFLDSQGLRVEDYLYDDDNEKNFFDRKDEERYHRIIADTYTCLGLDDDYELNRFKIKVKWKKKSVF